MTKYLIHWFPFCSGGLCDRILGLASSICIADILNMKILIKWDHCDLSSGFTINDDYNWYKNPVIFRHINLNNHESIDYFKNIDLIKEWGEDNIMIWSNINLFSYLLQNKNLKHLIYPEYIENFSSVIKLILNNIFIINPQVFDKISIYDIGIHIRTGDKQIYNKENEEFYRDYIIDIFKKVKKDIIKDNEIEKKIFISSDCLLAFEIAKDFFKNFNYYKGCIIHTSQEDKINEEGLHKVLIDLLTLANCNTKLYIGWNSNFSRIASLYNINRNFVCYEFENNPNILKQCTNKTLFEYFSWGKYT
jgi:hypothetical protein